MMKPMVFVLIALSFVSCNNYNKSVNDLNYNKPDTSSTIISATINSAAYPAIFESGFDYHTKVTHGEISYSFHSIHIGNIIIESGKIIACDPIVMYNASPFAQNFPIGRFAVDLAIAKTTNDERVAFSRISFTDSSIHKWEFALKNGQHPVSLDDSTFYCYGVDAGTGLFIDSVANEAFNKKENSEWQNIFVSNASKDTYKGQVYDFDGHNLATFTTGYGDGCYATYIGFDAKGNVAQLLTDFGLVQWWPLKKEK